MIEFIFGFIVGAAVLAGVIYWALRNWRPYL